MVLYNKFQICDRRDAAYHDNDDDGATTNNLLYNVHSNEINDCVHTRTVVSTCPCSLQLHQKDLKTIHLPPYHHQYWTVVAVPQER